PRVQLLLKLLLHALARDHGYPLPRTVPRKTLFKLSLHPRRSNIRTPSIHERHYLDKRNIDARVHILPQPPPSQLYRNFVRTPLAIHCIGRRRRRPALRSSSECQLNRGLEAGIHFEQLVAGPNPIAQLFIKIRDQGNEKHGAPNAARFAVSSTTRIRLYWRAWQTPADASPASISTPTTSRPRAPSPIPAKTTNWSRIYAGTPRIWLPNQPSGRNGG